MNLQSGNKCAALTKKAIVAAYKSIKSGCNRMTNCQRFTRRMIVGSLQKRDRESVVVGTEVSVDLPINHEGEGGISAGDVFDFDHGPLFPKGRNNAVNRFSVLPCMTPNREVGLT